MNWLKEIQGETTLCLAGAQQEVTQGDGNEPRGSLKGNHRRWFFSALPDKGVPLKRKIRITGWSCSPPQLSCKVEAPGRERGVKSDTQLQLGHGRAIFSMHSL